MKIKFNSDHDLPLNKPLKHFVWIIKMLQYEKTDVSEGIDVNKTSASKECELCCYWFFEDVEFKFEGHVCNGVMIY